MVNYLKTLEKKYDREIKNSCEEFRQIYLTCLYEHQNDDYVCNPSMLQFHHCIEMFDENFRKKYLPSNSLEPNFYSRQ